MGGGQGRGKAKALQQLQLISPGGAYLPWGQQGQLEGAGMGGPLELKRTSEQERACHVAFLKPGSRGILYKLGEQRATKRGQTT